MNGINIKAPGAVAVGPTRNDGRGYRLREQWQVQLHRGSPWLVVFVLAMLVLVPIVVLMLSAFRTDGLISAHGSWTTANFIEVFSDVGVYRMIGNTLIFSLGSTVVAMTLATAGAWLTERTDLPGKRAFRTLILLPMAIPPVLLAMAWTQLLSPSLGALPNLVSFMPWPDIYSMGGMILVQSLAYVPPAYLILVPALAAVDPSIEEASGISGANPFTTLVRITIPLILPAFLSAATILFIAALLTFDIPGVIGVRAQIPLLSSYMYFAVHSEAGFPQYGIVAALALVFVLLGVGIAAALQMVTRDRTKYVAVSGKNYKRTEVRLGPWRLPIGIAAWGYLFIVVVMPLSVLIITSMMSFRTAISARVFSTLTFQNFRDVLANPTIVNSTYNSLLIAALAATAAVILAFAAGRTYLRGGTAASVSDVLGIIPIGVPGIMIGLTLTYLFLSWQSVAIFGTVWIIVLAHTINFLPIASRTITSSMIQLHPELEEAAHVSGASPGRALIDINLPMMMPAIFVVWVWSATGSIRELSAALMLRGPHNSVLSTTLWGYWSDGRSPVAAAIGVFTILGLLVLLLIWDWASHRLNVVRGR